MGSPWTKVRFQRERRTQPVTELACSYLGPKLRGPRWRVARCLSQVAQPHTQHLPACRMIDQSINKILR